MKKGLLLIVLLGGFTFAFGQNFEELTNYKFSSKESYKKKEPSALASANYLFDNPANEQEINRIYAQQFILRWMEGTPDYTFEINEEAVELSKGNNGLLGLYLAGLTKTVLDHQGEPLSAQEMHLNAQELLLDYCADANNKMKPSKKIKQLLKARKN